MKLLKAYTRQELIDEALRFERENGRIPRKDEMMLYNGYPPIRRYLKIFGSWNNLLKVTPFKTKYEAIYNREFLGSELKRLQKDCGRIPSLSDLKASKGYPSLNIYLRVFGFWNNALNRLSQNSNHFYNWIMSNVEFKYRS